MHVPPAAVKAAIAVDVSKNEKTGMVAATYATQASCPPSCPLMGSGCYAESGHVAMVTRRAADAAAAWERTAKRAVRPVDIARLEAMAIDALVSGLPLRLHVVGDARTPAAARILAAACDRYRRRTGAMTAWTYTHAWRDVPRAAWGRVSVLASVESTRDAAAARRQGYAPAVVVDAHPADGRAWERDGVTWIPCPQQTRGVQCTACRLCWDADGLYERRHGIAFAAHGAGKSRALTVIQ